MRPNLFANGVPLTIDEKVSLYAYVYGGGNQDIKGNPSITIRENAYVEYVTGGSLNASLEGNSEIVVDGEVRTVNGGGRAESSASGKIDAVANMTGSTSIVVGETGSAGSVYGAGYAKGPSSGDAIASAQASIDGSTNIFIAGKVNEAIGGGYATCGGSYASSVTNSTAVANVTGDTAIAYAASAKSNSSSGARANGGGYAESTARGATNSATANVEGNTHLTATEDDEASGTGYQKSNKVFSYFTGGGYALYHNAQANVGGNVFAKTGRAVENSRQGTIGGGEALYGATANVTGTVHLDIVPIQNQGSKYENAYRIVGGGWATCGDDSRAETQATAGDTDVTIHSGVKFSNTYDSSIYANVIGGGFATSNNTDASVSGVASVTIGSNVYALEDIVGGGAICSISSGGGFSQATGATADVGATRITIGDNVTVKNLIGGSKMISATNSHAHVGSEVTANSEAITTETGTNFTVNSFYGGCYIQDSNAAHNDIGMRSNVTGSIKSSVQGGKLNGTFFGGSFITNSMAYANISGNIENVLSGFSFASSPNSYSAKVVGGGTIMGNNGSDPDQIIVSGDVSTRLKNGTLNGTGDNNNNSPWPGGRTGAKVAGSTELIFENMVFNNQPIYAQKSYSGAIDGDLTITLLGTIDTNLNLYPTWSNGNTKVVVGDGSTTTDISMPCIKATKGSHTTDVEVLDHANLNLTIADPGLAMEQVRDVTISQNGRLSLLHSTAQTSIAGDLVGTGTVSLPASGLLAGSGKLDGDLTLEVTGSPSAGQKFFDFSDESIGSVAFTDPDGKLVLTKDDSEVGRKKWVMQEQFTVAFDLGYDSQRMEEKVLSGSTVAEPAGLTREGFAFKGWYSDSDFKTEYDFTAPVAGNFTLYAKWTPLYTVTFEANGAEPAPDPEIVEEGAEATEPAEPKKEHYTFGGWYDNQEFSGDAWKFDTPVTDNLTLFAKWSILSYTVSFEANGGEPAPAAQAVEFGKLIAKPGDPTKKDYVFAGWYDNRECSGTAWDFDHDTVVENKTLYAKWVDGIKVTASASEHGTISPMEPQVFTGSPLAYAFTPDYGYRIDSVTVNGESVAYDKVGLRNGSIELSPAAETIVTATFVPLETGSAGDIIDNLPPVVPDVEPSAEEKDTVLDAKLDYESMPDDEKGKVDQERINRLNEAVANLPEVNIEVKLDISAELDTNVMIPDSQKSRFIGAVGKDEIESLKNGDASLLKVVVQVKSIDAPDDTAEDAELQKALGSNKVGQHFSANVTKQLFANPTDATPEKEQPIKTLPTPVQLTFGIPANLLNTPDGTSRTFAMARTHQTGDQWEALLLDDEDLAFETITVSTAKFSTCTIAYADTHTVTFMDGASAFASKQVDDGSVVDKPTDAPKREGFTFAGWCIDEAGAKPYDFAAPVTAPLTLYAKWIENAPPAPTTYTVSFDAVGGSPVASQVVAAGRAATEPTAPVREGYAFDGWFADGAVAPYDFSSPVNADLALRAGWTRLHSVSFDAAGGSPQPAAQDVREGGKAEEPAALEKEGFKFAGWFADGASESWDFGMDAVTGDTLLVAKWTPVEEPQPELHEVAFVTGEGGSTVEAQEVPDGQAAQEPQAPTREGYTFGGWYDNPQFVGEYYDFAAPVTAPLTLYAKWTKNAPPVPIAYTVSFDAAGGSPEPAAQDVREGGFVKQPQNPARDGYAFAGWFADEGLTVIWDFESDTVEGDLTLHAKWTENEAPIPDPNPTPEPTPEPGDDPVKPLPQQPGSTLGGTPATATALAPTSDGLGGTVALLVMLATGAALAAGSCLHKHRKK